MLIGIAAAFCQSGGFSECGFRINQAPRSDGHLSRVVPEAEGRGIDVCCPLVIVDRPCNVTPMREVASTAALRRRPAIRSAAAIALSSTSGASSSLAVPPLIAGLDQASPDLAQGMAAAALPSQVTPSCATFGRSPAVARRCFPGLRTQERPISENTLNAALRRLGYSKEAMSHGFREAASTLLSESGKWNPDAIERQRSWAANSEPTYLAMPIMQ
jgi:hypothetical protein